MSDIRKVAVFGAGVMGASIAAHVANAGIKVRLFDMATTNGKDRSAIAKAAIDSCSRPTPRP